MRFKRVLGLFDATAISLGAIIGAGIFVMTGIAAGMAGPAVILSIVIAAIVALFTAISFADLAANYPKEGAGYAFARHFISPFAGYLTGWMWSVSNIFAGATVSLGFANYLSIFFPSVPANLIAIILIAALLAVNALGTGLSAKLNSFLVVVKLLVLAAFVAFGAFAMRRANFAPFAPNGTMGMLSAASLIFFAYIGFGRIATASEEVRDPRRTIPRAILLSLGISTVIYALVSVVAVGLVGNAALAASASPLADAAKASGFGPLWIIIALGGLVATASVVLTTILGVSRVIFSISGDAGFGRKEGDLFIEICAVSLLMAALTFMDFGKIAAFTSFVALAYYVACNYAAIRMPAERKSHHWLVPYAGLASCLFLMLFLGKDSWIYGTALLAIGAVVSKMLVMREKVS